MNMSEAVDPRPPFPADDYWWCSICSRHRDYNPSCGICNKGRWVNRSYQELEDWLYERDYKLWHEWANRAESPDRTWLEKIFPKLARPK